MRRILVFLFSVFALTVFSVVVIAGSSYEQIDQETAKQMMEKDDGHILVDVRHQEEYDEGHIPGAILIPNETITSEKPDELPDLDQIILIYCRSGRRSKEAAQKLADMGYTNIYEFGGIIDWTGDVVTKEIWNTSEIPVKLRYDRMWEYGDYAETDDADTINALVHAIGKLQVGEPTDMGVDDYTDILTFEFKDGSTSRLIFEDNIWVKEDDERYIVEGIDDFRSLLDKVIMEDPEIKMLIGDTEVPVTWEENASVDELRALLPLTIEMSMYGGFEQVGPIGQSITSDDQQITTDSGDVVLYSDDQIVVFYGSNTWAYTRLGHIDLSQKEMADLLGNGNVTITLTED
jgi:rhodanese-related sulfurtransferase